MRLATGQALVRPDRAVPVGTEWGDARLSGRPALTFDREGTAYYASIDFNRTDDTNGIWVNRSTNGGFTWSRGCVAIDASSPPNPTDDIARCGGPGDPRTPGDGTVSFQPDADLILNDSLPFEDKEYIGAGPRPVGVAPRCFAPETKTPISPGSPGCPEEWIGPDRVYVTWTRFDLDGTSRIHLSYSDDRARSWWVPRAISGSAPFCVGRNCDQNQFLVPTVSPERGVLYVAFENFNQHTRRAPVGGCALEPRRPDVPRSVLRNAVLRRQLPGKAGLRGPWGGLFAHQQLLPDSADRRDRRPTCSSSSRSTAARTGSGRPV